MIVYLWKFFEREIVWVGRDLRKLGDSFVCLSGIGLSSEFGMCLMMKWGSLMFNKWVRFCGCGLGRGFVWFLDIKGNCRQIRPQWGHGHPKSLYAAIEIATGDCFYYRDCDWKLQLMCPQLSKLRPQLRSHCDRNPSCGLFFETKVMSRFYFWLI